MTKHRIRRWFQFGILDLLILTTIVAIMLVLGRPAPAKVSNTAPPWLLGFWQSGFDVIDLFPDGFYQVRSTYDGSVGVGWTLSRRGRDTNEFLLTCGTQRLVIRSEWGSGFSDLLNEDGSLQKQLTLLAHLEGPRLGGKPHGTWRIVAAAPPKPQGSLEYWQGELVAVRGWDGVENLQSLNNMRASRGLPEWPERDFPKDGMREEKSP